MAEGFTEHAYTPSRVVISQGVVNFYEIVGVDPATVREVDVVSDEAIIHAVHISTILGSAFLNAYDLALQQERAEQVGFSTHALLTPDQLDVKRSWGLWSSYLSG
ncbi:MAG: hypothetical protein JWO47_27 [Candidatus Saccharibacteria bacterium]|nr:hypothetical protein [Candidatus Saccharibacteria bacterium]